MSELWEKIKEKDKKGSINTPVYNSLRAIEYYVEEIHELGQERYSIFYEYLKEFCLEKQFFVTLDIFSSDKKNIAEKLCKNFKNHFYPFKIGNKPYKALRDAIDRQKNKIFFNHYKLIYEPKEETDANSLTRYWFQYKRKRSSIAIIRDIDFHILKNIMIDSTLVKEHSKKWNIKSKYLIYSFLFWQAISEYFKQNIKISLKDLTISYVINIDKSHKYDTLMPINNVSEKEDLETLKELCQQIYNAIEDKIDEINNKSKINIEIDNFITSLQKCKYFKQRNIALLYTYLFYSSVDDESELDSNKLREVINIKNPERARKIFKEKAQKFYENVEAYWAQAANILRDEIEKRCIEYYGKEELESLKAECYKKLK